MPYSSRGSVFLQTQPQLQDKAYKRFAAGVERSLALFDTQLLEWADYISFLGRLLKVRAELLIVLRILLTSQ
jgi:hypothetical protein